MLPKLGDSWIRKGYWEVTCAQLQASQLVLFTPEKYYPNVIKI